MLENWFVSDLTIVTNTRSAYGDLVYSGQRSIKGRILEHGAIVLTDNLEEKNTDAMMWLPADEVVTTDTVVNYRGINYRVVKITQAKRANETTIQFIKCWLQKYKAVAGIS